MEDVFKKLEEFHEVFGIDIGKPISVPNSSQHTLHYNLLQEELLEFKEACEEGDIVKIADALADMQFILSSVVIEHGLHDIFEDLCLEVCRSNMSKRNPDGTVERRKDGKVVTRGENFFRPNLKGILDKYPIHVNNKKE